MKKLTLLLALAASNIAAFAQEDCNNPHRIFRVPGGKTPAVVTKLGTNPQFATLRHASGEGDIYNKMKALGNNAKYRNEINSLLMSLGYTGVNDPAFDRSDVHAADVPFGAIGMLGDGGHNYRYSMIAVPGQPTVKAWRIDAANDGCDLYVMSDCGNAFYHSNAQVMERERIVTVREHPEGNAKQKLKVYARYRDTDDCTWCGECDIPGAGNVKERKILLAEEVQVLPVTTDENGYEVKNVYIDVDKKTFKRLKYEPVQGNEGWERDAYAAQ